MRSQKPQKWSLPPDGATAVLQDLGRLYNRPRGLWIFSMMERLQTELLCPKVLKRLDLQEMEDIGSAYVRDARRELLHRDGFDVERCDDQQPMVEDEWRYPRPVLSQLLGYYAITRRRTGWKCFVAEVLELNDGEYQAMQAWTEKHGFIMNLCGHLALDRPGFGIAIRLVPKKQNKRARISTQVR